MSRGIIKAHTYFPVSSEPFDLPLPLKLELLCANTLLCVYSVAKDKIVDYSYNTNTEIPLLTPTDRPLDINDIYFLIRSRVFPNNPYTAPAELAKLGLSEYNPYRILEKTFGIMPMSAYWFRKSGDDISYETALARYNEIMFGVKPEQGESGIEDFLGMN